MTHKLQRNGTRILVALMAATVLLTVFAGAAAATVDTKGEFNETSFDDPDAGDNLTVDTLLNNDPAEVKDEINITIDDNQINSSDTIQFELRNLDQNGDFKIANTDVTSANGNTNPSARIVNSEGNSVGVDDAVNVTLGADNTGSSYGFNLSVTLEADNAIQDKTYIDSQTDILKVDIDGSDGVGTGTTAGVLTVEAGVPDQLVQGANGDLDSATYDATGTKDTANDFHVAVQDQAGNPVNSTYSNTDVTFTFDDTGSNLFSARTQSNKTGYGDNPVHVANVSITNNSGSAVPSGDIPAGVGEFDLDASVDTAGNTPGLTTNFSGTIDVPTVNSATNVTTVDANNADADGDTALINVSLQGTNDKTRIDPSDISSGIDINFQTSNNEGAIDVNGTDVATATAQTIKSDVQSNNTDYLVNSTEASTSENRDNGAYTLDVSGPGDTSSETINVNPTTPHYVATVNLNSSIERLNTNDGPYAFQVQIRDQSDNIVDNPNYYDAGTSTDLKVDTKYLNGDQETRSTTYTVTSASDANKTVEVVADESSSTEIGAKLGTFDLDVTQTSVTAFSQLDDARSATTKSGLVVVPQKVVVNQTAGTTTTAGQNVTASTNNNLEVNVTLTNGTGGSKAIQDENISNVRFNLSSVGTGTDGSTIVAGINNNVDNDKASGVSGVGGLYEIDSPDTSTPNNASNVTILASEQDVGVQSITAQVNETKAVSDLSAGPEPSGSTDDYYIEPDVPTTATIKNVNQSSIGIVHDDKTSNVSVTFNLTDTHGNLANYGDTTTNVSYNQRYNVSVGSGLNGSTFAGSLNVSVVDDSFVNDVRFLNTENVTQTVTFYPTDIDNSTTVGQDRNVISVDSGVETTVESDALINISHEAYNLQQGSNRLSLPNDAEVFQNNTDYTTSWNNTESQYDAGDIDLTSPGTEELQKGIFVNASSNGRIAFAYETDAEDVSPNGRFLLKEGWNLVGTNFDISNESNLPYRLEDDLVDVIPIKDDHNSAPYVYDGQLSSQLDASSDLNSDTDDLNPSIGLENDGEYGTYWVKVNSSSDNDKFEREILTSQYKPSDRDD